jgi:hypothetical protein
MLFKITKDINLTNIINTLAIIPNVNHILKLNYNTESSKMDFNIVKYLDGDDFII